MGIRAFFRYMRLERSRRRLAVSLAENWRARGCFLRLGDGVLFDLALFWVRAFEAARALDGVEAGRDARARKVADLCVSAALSQGESVLNFEGLPLWGVQRVFEDGGAGCAADSAAVGAEGKA